MTTPARDRPPPATRYRAAALYALLHRGTPGDVAFHLARARGADRVLELGCGYGRLLLPLAQAGHRVVGLERDAGLLGLAAAAVARRPAALRERVRLVRGDMRRFALEARFDRVLIAYNGLYCLDGEAQAVACLRSAAAHLAPGGRVVLDAYAVDGFHEEAHAREDEGAQDAEPVATIRWRGRVYDVLESSTWQRAAQRIVVHYRYLPRGGGPAYEDTVAHRYLLTSQLPALCAAAGLRVEAAWGDFHGAPLGPRSEHMACVLAPARGA